MYSRTNYEMTKEEEEALLDTSKPTPETEAGICSAMSQEKNTINAWKALGVIKGFDCTTIRRISGKGTRFFTAIPSEKQSLLSNLMNSLKKVWQHSF